jgi:hypothetical protein
VKIAVITSSIGTNNLLPQKKFNNVDYHAFVDDKSTNKDWIKHPDLQYWNQHFAIEFSSDPVYRNRRNAKIYKIIPFAFLPEYDYYFWIDSTHILENDPNELIDTYLKDADVAVFKHPQRNCIYDEGEFIKQIKFDYPNLINDQLAFYADMCYPKGNGLYELPVRFQRNNQLTQKMGLMWWEQICMFSSRDQLSFPFVCHQLGVKLSILPGVANTIKGNAIMPQVIISNHSRTF